jgi:iron complex outermembrane recepter protein
MKISLFGRLCAGAANILVSSAALAQSVTPTSQPTASANQLTTSSDQNGLAEITVTAQRRSENLERTPVAVAVLSTEDMANQQIVTQSDLQNVVPGLQVRESLNNNQLNYAIRGQTVAAFSSSTPAVLPYVNEVQVNGPGGSSAFYDLQSIQVLKGPQGTLFGRNATGGALLFTTTKPGATFGGYFDVDAGNYNEKKFEGAIDLPISSDAVLARVAGFYQRRDGYQYNLFTQSTVGDVDRYGVRTSLTLKFSDRLKNDLVVDFYHAGGSSKALVLSYVAPVSTHEPPIPANLLYSPSLDTAIGVPGAWAAYLAANPKVPVGGLYAALAAQNARGPFTVDVNNPGAYKANNTLVSNITTFEITDNLQFKNVAGYNNIRSRAGEDADGSPYGIDGTATGQTYGFDNSDTQYTEEPQFIGKAFADALTYVAGGYYANEKSTSYLASSVVNVEPIIAQTTLTDHNLNRDKSAAGYGQGTYDLSRATGIAGLSVSAGVRYTTETVSLATIPPSQYLAHPNPLYHSYLEHTFDKVSWQFGLQEQLNPELMIYAVSRRSFRSGGFNNHAPPFAGFGNQGGSGFDAETATDAELGFKFQGTAGGVPTRLNVATYYESIKNTQETVFTNVAGLIVSVTANVPKSRVTGFEAEGEIDPTNWLKVGTSAAFTDAAFIDPEVTVLGTPPATVAFGPYPDTPRWSGSVFSEVHVPVTAAVSAAVRGQLYDQTLTYFSPTNNSVTPGTKLPGYTVANFTLSLEDTKAGWWAGVIIKNAFNRVYYVGGLAGTNIYATNAALPGDPRTVVGEVRVKFSYGRICKSALPSAGLRDPTRERPYSSRSNAFLA